MTHRIIETELIDISMPLRQPYVIAYETITHAPNLLLRLETDNGLIGYGCAAPDRAVGGETPDSVRTGFRSVVEPLLHRADASRVHYWMDELRTQIADQPALLAMVNMALYDLLAQRAGLPIYELLGAYRRSIPTSITIGICSVAETLAEGKRWQHAGFSIYKIKGGHSVELDVERLARFRETFGAAIQLRFDANQGYTVEETLRFIRMTENYGLEILEQPTPKTDLQKLGAVTHQSDLPVMADESLMNLGDAFRIARSGLANMLNIKLMKVGGITHAAHINSVAKAAGMEVMVGCMDECALGICSGLHFALAYPNVRYADLDGHLDLLDDPTAGCFRLEAGILYPKAEAGWGFGGLG